MNLVDPAAGEYPDHCGHCTAEYDLLTAVWCSCSASRPTKLCPFCLRCCCSLGLARVDAFWQVAPAALQAERETLRSRRMLLGDMLVASGRITTPQLIQALNQQSVTGDRLGECLVKMGAIAAEELSGLLDRQHAPITLDLEERLVDGSLTQIVGIEFCLAHRLLPVEKDNLAGGKAVLVAMANPSDLKAREILAERLEARVIVGLSSERTILDRLKELFPAGSRQAGFGETGRESLALTLIGHAIGQRATHLYLDLTPSIARLSYRVDGRAYRVHGHAGRVDHRHVDGLMEWLGESRRRTLMLDGQPWHLEGRLAHKGAATSLRIMMRNCSLLNQVPAIHSFDPVSLVALRQEMGRSSGLVILTGSSRSDGERAFWGLANLVARRLRPVWVRGAPVCDDLPYIQRSDATGACGDGGVLFSYQTRQGLWPEMLQRAARQLVVIDVRPRLVRQALMAAPTRGPGSEILSTRLRLLVRHMTVRRICTQCRIPFSAAPEDLLQAGLTPDETVPATLYRGEGCSGCRISPGYRGSELLMAALPGHARTLTDQKGGWTEEGSEAAFESCMEDRLRSACLGLLQRGLTTLEEFGRALPRGDRRR